MDAPKILIVDFGSQLTENIARELRGAGYRSAVFPPHEARAWWQENEPKGVILSGSDASVHDADAPRAPAAVFTSGVPALGICYGMQEIAHRLGGVVVNDMTNRHYGDAEVMVVETDNLLFGHLADYRKIPVWASHGDSIKTLPLGFRQIAAFVPDGSVAAMCDSERNMYGVQFHPEAIDTPDGRTMLACFAEKICHCDKDWEEGNVVEEIKRSVIRESGGHNVVLGTSGGSDSTILAHIAARALGKRLLCIIINTGALRHGELLEMTRNVSTVIAGTGAELKIVEAAHRFLPALQDVVNPHVKRARFASVYEDIFREETERFDAIPMQGGIASDFIESEMRNAALIKQHHNTRMKGPQPFQRLFKHEVRAIGRALGIPEEIVARHPSPGPGGYLGVLNAGPTEERLQLWQWAEEVTTRIVKKHGWYERISQLVVAVDFSPTAFVKGDKGADPTLPSTGLYTVKIKAVISSDFMTAKAVQFPAKLRAELTPTLTKHSEIADVVFSETSKPPATILFQ